MRESFPFFIVLRTGRWIAKVEHLFSPPILHRLDYSSYVCYTYMLC